MKCSVQGHLDSSFAFVRFMFQENLFSQSQFITVLWTICYYYYYVIMLNALK